MFYFFFKDVPGLFSFQHLIYIIISIALVSGLVILYLKKLVGKEQKIILFSFILLVTLEIAKICYVCFYQKLSSKLDDWVPLYFCSLTMYALGLSSFGKGKTKLLGDCFLFFGGIVSGVAFLFYPSTALIIRPLFHPLTIHSLIYHSVAVFVGVMIALKGELKPNIKHLVSYLEFTLLFSVIAYIVNIIFNQNFMLINTPWEIPVLQLVYKITGFLYPVAIAFGQIFLTFFVSLYGYKLIEYLLKRRKSHVSI